MTAATSEQKAEQTCIAIDRRCSQRPSKRQANTGSGDKSGENETTEQKKKKTSSHLTLKMAAVLALIVFAIFGFRKRKKGGVLQGSGWPPPVIAKEPL